MLTETSARRLWIRRLAWVAGVYVVIAAAAWKGVPWAVRAAFSKIPQYLPGFQAGAEAVSCNPFTLRLTIKGLYFKHERLGEIASARVFSVALKPTAFLRLAIGLRDLKLEGPRLALSIASDGSSILDQLPKSAPQPAAKPGSAFVPRLVVGLLEVSDGEIDLESRLPQAPQKLLVRPISFRLENLSTLPNDGGAYRMRARTDRGERLDWEGMLTVRPLRLKGRVALVDADLARATSVAPTSPVEISKGRFAASTDYDIALGSAALTVSLQDARASVKSLMWRLKSQAGGPRGPFALTIGPAKITASASLSDRAGQRLTMGAEVPVESTGLVRLKAAITPKPLAGEVECEVVAFPLAPFSPLAPPPTQVSLDSGNIGLKARAAFSGSDATADVSLALADLTISDKASRGALVRLGRLAVKSVRVSTKSRKAEIAEVSIERPFLRLARGGDGRTNIESALGISFSSAPAGASHDASTLAVTASGEAPWQVRLKRFSVSGGRITVQDASVAPPFSLSVTEARAELSGLANDGRAVAPFSAKALIADAAFSAEGKVKLSTASAWVESRLKADAIQLPVFSPFSGKVIGYKIDKGAFSFDLDHHLDGRKISTKNHAVIDQLTLGDKVESPDAIKAPVKLGLALLKDRRGVIDLDIPIDGNLDDPNFHVAGAILKTFVNLIIKAAASPFTALGQALGSKEDLGHVSFPAGRASLAAEPAAQLAQLAQALADRPELIVGMRGTAGRSDALALGDRALLRRLRGPDAGDSPLTAEEENRMKALYLEAFGTEASAASEARAKLVEKWRATTAELRDLALARASAIKGAFLTHGLAEARIFSQEPAAGPDSADEPCQLQLDVR